MLTLQHRSDDLGFLLNNSLVLIYDDVVYSGCGESLLQTKFDHRYCFFIRRILIKLYFSNEIFELISILNIKRTMTNLLNRFDFWT